jgi:hypothetical protein
MPEAHQGCAATTPANGGIGIALPERRRQARQIALLRVALLHADGASDICLVKNLSANGLSARVYRKLAVDEPVEVEFHSGELLAGSVVWEWNWEVGLAFPQPIDVAAVLGSRWVTENSRRRALPRIPVECPGLLSDGFRSVEIMLRDISQGGASVQTSAPIKLMTNVVVTLPNLPLLTGVVRWTSNSTLGISFNECIAFELLAQWIHEQRKLASASNG